MLLLLCINHFNPVPIFNSSSIMSQLESRSNIGPNAALSAALACTFLDDEEVGPTSIAAVVASVEPTAEDECAP